MTHAEDKQEDAWRNGWRPEGRREPDADEQAFLREHPGWLQAAWAHPDYWDWVRRRAALAGDKP